MASETTMEFDHVPGAQNAAADAKSKRSPAKSRTRNAPMDPPELSIRTEAGKYFVIGGVYVWVACDVATYESFEMECRRFITVAELREMNAALAEIDNEVEVAAAPFDDQVDELNRSKSAIPEDDADALAANGAELVKVLTAKVEAVIPIAAKRKDVIAPFVRSWNLYGDDGTTTFPLPSPREAGAAAFEYLDTPLVAWIMGSCLQAYRSGRGFTTFDRVSSTLNTLSKPADA